MRFLSTASNVSWSRHNLGKKGEDRPPPVDSHGDQSGPVAEAICKASYTALNTYSGLSIHMGPEDPNLRPGANGLRGYTRRASQEEEVRAPRLSTVRAERR